MNITRLILDKAKQCLKNCKTLSDAEEQLGGAWFSGKRDIRSAAITWGLFDGYKHRPLPEQIVLSGMGSLYKEAWEAGKKLREREQQT
jgi:hypothetical protein